MYAISVAFSHLAISIVLRAAKFHRRARTRPTCEATHRSGDPAEEGGDSGASSRMLSMPAKKSAMVPAQSASAPAPAALPFGVPLEPRVFVGEGEIDVSPAIYKTPCEHCNVF